MEAFSLLKYWKHTPNSLAGTVNTNLSSSTILSPLKHHSGDDDDDDDDDGPFFDLEFAALPADVDDERRKVEERESGDETDDEDEDEEEDDDDEIEDRNMSFSPSDDLFFKGKLIQIDGSDSAPLREMEEIINAAESGNQMPLSAALVKSATKLRVFMLGLKRSKSDSKQILPREIIHRGKNVKNGKNKFTTVRLKMEEVKVPIISLLTRAPSNTVKNTQSDEKSFTEDGNNSNSNSNNNEEKKNRKEVVQRYLKLVRPLYVKVSKKSEGEKADEEKVEEKVEITTMKNAKARLNFKVIARKHLGKSKSAVVHTMSSVNTTSLSSKKSDDSLLQQQDDGEDTISVLMRSASEPSQWELTREAEATAEEGT
ncbi:hypothetical protein KSS87_001103 [Heliosperma pusillum]|nr:hypothetical protein KSS87_001103 [Heliosperma pusillum]